MPERSNFFGRKIRKAGEVIVSGATTFGALILCPGDDIAMSIVMLTDTVGHGHVQEVSLPQSGNFIVKEPPFVQVKPRKYLQKFKRVAQILLESLPFCDDPSKKICFGLVLGIF